MAKTTLGSLLTYWVDLLQVNKVITGMQGTFYHKSLEIPNIYYITLEIMKGSSIAMN